MFRRDTAQTPVAPAAPAAPAAPPPVAPAAPPAAVPSESEEGARVLSLDISEVSTEFTPMPVGIYPAVVDEVRHVPHSAKSGQPYIGFVFKVTDPAHKNRKLFQNCSLQPDALWKLIKTLEVLGLDVSADQLNLDLDALVGLPCSISVSVGDYQGKSKNEVVEILPPKGAAAAAAPF